METRVDFISEMLAESEARDEQIKVVVDRLRADAMLSAIAVLEGQMNEVQDLCDREVKLIEEYRARELARLDKKRSWLLFNLEGFTRSSREKTIRLPHGTLKLRKGRDRVAVVAMEKFLDVGRKLGLIRKVPESETPDVQAILRRIQTTGDIPDGVEYILGEIRFSYTTNGGSDEPEEREQSSQG